MAEEIDKNLIQYSTVSESLNPFSKAEEVG
jgi:hypothetical protein